MGEEQENMEKRAEESQKKIVEAMEKNFL